MEPVVYLFIGISLLCAGIAVALGSAAAIALASISAALGVIVYKGWDVIWQVVLRRSRVVQVLNGYELGGDRKVAIINRNGGFVATSAALLDASRIAEFDRSKLEAVIGRASGPFKLVMVAKPLDISKVLDRLRTSRYRNEIELSRLYKSGADDVRIRRVKAKLEAIECDIGSITSGKAPLQVLYYVMHACASSGRFAAQDGALSGIAALCSSFDAAMNSRSRVLEGNELLDALRFDAMME